METQDRVILIVDDDQRNIFALSAVLKSRGFQCFSAESAHEAFALLDSHPEIAMVLLDVMMPEMDGLAAIDLMRSRSRADLPIISVTAQVMPGDREKCIAAGASDYVSKPVDVDELMESLNKYLV